MKSLRRKFVKRQTKWIVKQMKRKNLDIAQVFFLASIGVQIFIANTRPLRFKKDFNKRYRKEILNWKKVVEIFKNYEQ